MEMIGHNDIIQTTEIIEMALTLFIPPLYHLSCGIHNHRTFNYITESGDMVMRTYRHEIQTP
jgi:hypothetical protein